ncbi:ankyrin repeat domain-containing protein [Endozoicomonas gorgoniicola]|uniref:Ankyrin repeat domain-containing protein n=1 Tax=Endozoicomonas gorgoniicola TaxID=1234144 RepID=A0ABT3MYH9_9GAMM|nr:ankyrin repeat domain-containing protein [Endozoicomonas gorgoniicola]MCW7554054.1 ankyrin repeat domain-containing protein [Endozoicomonas gorgoniicola]
MLPVNGSNFATIFPGLKNDSIDSELMTAIKEGNTKKAERLIKHGANVNYDNNGYDHSPLRTAVDKGDLLMAELLIEHGANVN